MRVFELAILTASLLWSPLNDVYAQQTVESPYSIFGDTNPVLDASVKNNNPNWSLIILMADSTFAHMEIADDMLTVKDSEGNILTSQAVNPAIYAMFTTIDPKAEEMPWVSPYLYCFGNPVNLVDRDGKRPTDYEAALMASAVYEDKNYNSRIDQLQRLNWAISGIGSTLQSLNHPAKTGIGLQSMVFEKTIDGVTEYAYVFAGTNSWEDLVEDVTQIIGITSQYPNAIGNAKILNEIVGSSELTFVGHSLGGGEAAAASMATGRAAITFNPAAVSPATRIINSLYGEDNIVNYISSTPKVLGRQLTVDYITNIQNQIGIYAPGINIPISVGFLPSHTIDDIIKAFKSIQ